MRKSSLFLFFGFCLPIGCLMAFAGERSSSWFLMGDRPIQHGVPSLKVAELQRSCVQCHGLAHQEWGESAHAKAWVNPLFQEGFRLEPKARCVHCHAPLHEQFYDYKLGKNSELLASGINCVACHVRGGEVYFSKESSGAPHKVINDPEFGSAKYCAGCHEFKVIQVESNSPSFAQSTFTEWMGYREMGGTKTCLQCHSSATNHRFPASRDAVSLPSAIKFLVKKSKGELVFSLENREMGHSYPTGDMFREVVVEAKFDSENSFQTVIHLGKKYSKENGQVRLVSDSRLKPKEIRAEVVKIPVVAKALAYRIQYYRSPDFIRNHSKLPENMWLKTLKSGVVQLR